MIRSIRMGDLRGFDLQEGRLQVFDAGRCDELIEELGHCLGNNPSTPYVTAFFEDFGAPFGRVQLDRDEALVFVGRTPPESLYFSLNAAVHERTYDGGLGTPVGSVAASLHDRRILHRGPDVFDAPMVVVASADRAVAQQIRRRLQPLLDRMGVVQDIHNQIELPHLTAAERLSVEGDPAYEDITVIGLRMGHEPDDDRFSFTWRVAGANPEADWFDADAIHQAVFRLTPHTRMPHDSWVYPHLPPLRDSENLPPSELVEGLRALATRLASDAQERGLQTVRIRFGETVFDGFRCVENGIPCGNSDDALYLGSDRVKLPDGSIDAGVFVVGVVHPDVADLGSGPRLAYSNLNLQNADEQRALTGWLHDELRGTARERFPGGLSGVSASVFDTLYVREVSRHCSHPSCIPLDDLPAGALLNFLERAYLDLGTGTGPAPQAILEPRLVIYGPRLVPRILQNHIEVLGP